MALKRSFTTTGTKKSNLRKLLSKNCKISLCENILEGKLNFGTYFPTKGFQKKNLSDVSNLPNMGYWFFSVNGKTVRVFVRNVNEISNEGGLPIIGLNSDIPHYAKEEYYSRYGLKELQKNRKWH